MTNRYLTAAGLAELSAQLSARDEAMIRTVTELRFSSGRQLERWYFIDASDPAANARAARRSLRRLVELGLFDRLERRVGGVRRGSAGFVYCLAPWGQRLAMARGWLPEQRRRRSLVHGTLFVHHSLMVSELHVRLVEGDRAKRFELLELIAGPTCWRSFVGFGNQRQVKPDSFVRLGRGPWEDSFFVEVTEALRAAAPWSASCSSTPLITGQAPSRPSTTSFQECSGWPRTPSESTRSLTLRRDCRPRPGRCFRSLVSSRRSKPWSTQKPQRKRCSLRRTIVLECYKVSRSRRRR